jgi:hypothetical protein
LRKPLAGLEISAQRHGVRPTAQALVLRDPGELNRRISAALEEPPN